MKGLILSQKEQARLQALNKVLEGWLRVSEASRILGVSERHGWRLLAAYRKEGAAALTHGNRGRPSAQKVPEEVRARVVELAQGLYQGFNQCHLTEVLGEREGVLLSRSTVRRILMSHGLKSPRRRRPPQHRCRRERYPQEGMLLQIDGSRHDWLEGRGPYLTLVAAVDDATGTVPYALFREQEDAQGYFLMLKEVIGRKGIPLALYSDRHGIFQRSPRVRESLQEQLSGERQPTQFGRALRELGIQPIFALSPQAKGRIERFFGTLQERLVAELRLAGAGSADEANQVLPAFLSRFNGRFGVPALRPGSAYREVPEGLDPARVLCFKYPRAVASDNTVRFGGHTLQLLPGLDRTSYAHARVEVQELLDGSLVVSYQGKALATTEAPPHPVTLRARKGARGEAEPSSACLVVGVHLDHEGAPLGQGNNGNGHKPRPDHPWRKPALTKSLNS